MTSKLITNSLKFILILALVYVVFEVLYSDAAQLTVPSDVRTQTMILNPQDSAPASPTEGQIYYNNTDNKLYYCDGTNWKVLGPEKTVATKIVSAYNSVGATRVDGTACLGNGTACSNPKADYTCDGTDDQVKINRAINSLPIDPNGVSYGVVYLLEGTYNISTALEDGDLPASGETVAGIIPHSNTAIIGTGRGTVLKVKLNESNVNVINASGTATAPLSRILISQLMITDANTSGTANLGINFATVTYSKIDRVWVENIRGSGIYLSSCSNNTISNNNVQGTTADGISLTSSSNNIISNNNLQGNGSKDISLTSSSNNNTVSNNNVYNSKGSGIYLYSSCNNNTVSNNNVQDSSFSGLRGIYLYSCNNNTISNNNVQNNAWPGIGILLSSSSNNNTISNNNVQINAGMGIWLSFSSNNTVTGNVIYESGYDGIKLEASSSSNIISSNRLYDSSAPAMYYGINISTSNCAGNYLSGNLIDGLGYIDPATPPSYDHRIQDLGTGTKYTDKAKLTFEQAPSQDPGSLGTINATATYIPLNPTTSPGYDIGNITDGKSGGDLLILENINATNYITIPNGANTRLSVKPISGIADTPLYQNDILSLIWDGNGTAGVGDWVEIGYADN